MSRRVPDHPRLHLCGPIIWISLVLLGFLLAGCSNAPVPDRTPVVVRIEVTATRPPPSSTPRPAPTATSTPTPTPTAPPAEIYGDLRSPLLHDPTPEAGAYCGLVDTLDFPLDPPDAAGVRGGQDFGVYRSRYGKNHAGEDWGFRGGSAFGEPVFAIGHGLVTYADGLGWGADQGVVIVRHYFADGSTVLSFYGHLDPPSVVLRPGECVTRGQQVGAIGRPRTSPHLHFEIRTIFPYVPGPGYWDGDPTTAGWLAPSAFINQFRMRQNEAVAWAFEDFPVDELAGPLTADTFVVREDGRLLGLYTPAGGVRWMHELDGSVTASVVSEEAGQVYLLSLTGRLTALRLPESGETSPDGGYLVPVWEVETQAGRLPELLPAPWGGVVVTSRDGVAAYSADGSLRWSEQGVAPADWTADGERLIVSSTEEGGGLQIFGADGVVWQADGLEGKMAAAEEGLYVLTRDRLVLLSRAGLEETALPLPDALGEGDLAPVPGGGVLVLHADAEDYRLLLIKEGELTWERSLAGQVTRGAALVAIGDQVYVLAQEAGSYAETLTVLRVAVDSGDLERVFVGSTREPASSRLVWMPAGGGRLVVRFGAGALVLLDTGIWEEGGSP